MNRTNSLCALVLAMGMVGSAVANEGFYVGASAGQASVDACGDAGALGFTSCDDEDTGWKIFGGWELNQNFAFEAAYVDLGEVSASLPGLSVSGEMDGFVVDVKGTLPITEEFGVFAKVGLISWEIDGGGAASGFDDDGADAMYGVGVQYMINDQIGIVGEWELYDTDDEADLLSVGALVKF